MKRGSTLKHSQIYLLYLNVEVRMSRLLFVLHLFYIPKIEKAKEQTGL